MTEVRRHHIKWGSPEWVDFIVKTEADLAEHLHDLHGMTQREAVEAVLRSLLNRYIVEQRGSKPSPRPQPKQRPNPSEGASHDSR